MILNLDFTIEEIYHNNVPGLVVQQNSSIIQYLEPSSTTFFLELIKDVNETLFSYSDSIHFLSIPELFDINIVYTRDKYILICSCDKGSKDEIIRELVRINNQQINKLREFYKTNTTSTFDTSIYDELSKVNSKLMNMQRELNQRNAELTILNEKFRRMGLFDFLTDLPNRRSFFDDIHRFLPEENYDLIMMDLNNFKIINDTMGHDKGDEVLIIFANLLQKYVPDTAKVYRLGGDEFAILIPYRSVINMEQITTAIENQLRKIHRDLGIAYGKVRVGYEDINDDKKFELAMQKADELMYQHKIKTKGAQ